MTDFKRRDIEDTIWSVLTSFALEEEEEKCDKTRYFLVNKGGVFISGGVENMARAEVVCACIEAAFACNLEDFKVKISDEAIFNLLVLCGFENILILDGDIKNGFCLYSDETVFARGNFEKEKTTANIDIYALLKICKNEGGNISKSLVYAECGAEGAAYDICYNLRVNGCIIEMYTKDGDIKSAEEYAKKEGHSALVRCFADGTVEIKDLVKDEITKTTVSEFLGYYEDENGCDCHDHEHHDCDCGHHH